MSSVHKKWPNCLIQFEDFSTEVAFDLLEKNRHNYNCFNDDIQGTGAVVLSGFINAVKLTKIPMLKQKLLFYGAGSAAVGVAQTFFEYLKFEGYKDDEIKDMIYLVDTQGLVTINRGDKLASHKVFFARKDFKDNEVVKELMDIVKRVKPTCLIGLSSSPGTFTKEILGEICNYSEKPIILSLSNPSSKAECSAEEAYKYTDGKCIFASGSPWDNVILNGKTYVPGQGNNMYIFPGLGLGGVVSKSKIISENMVLVASRSLADYVTEEELNKGRIYPELEKIRDISFHIAKKVCEQSVKENLCGVKEVPKDWGEVIKSYIFDPHYPSNL
jgi:malate dehydrogenase (oxaloacetate-decarboxylating)(NADP+)